jgi:hypothetical protein
VAEELSALALAGRRPEESLAARVSPGAPGQLLLGELKERLREAEERARTALGSRP